MDGPVGHFWYTFLDKNVYPQEPTSNRAVVLKMLLDQIVWAPFFSCIFFAFTNTLAVSSETRQECQAFSQELLDKYFSDQEV